MMESHGYQNTVNMAGGLLGATDMSGNVVEPGWVACVRDTVEERAPARPWEALETVKKSEPGRSWKELSKP